MLVSNSVHAAVIAINDAIEKEIAEDTMKALHNPNAMLLTLINDNQELYQDALYNAKQSKSQSALNKVWIMSEQWQIYFYGAK